ncbi:hypothetical protein [Sphingomonas sp. 3P27F8]|uniref:hypothetical protein n=1 Tax=Sphingomonas sp. 3P27F8 TaxID=2502213 RepID=UPI0010F859A3|nr:hypothetical protein [Sphingomonas sp. 3P27F8]
MKGTRPRQYTLSLKVDEERKKAFAERCAAAGVTQSEMLERCVFGRLPDEVPVTAILRDHLALVHHLRAALADGVPIDNVELQGLVDVTRELIAAVRHSLA